MVDAEAIPLELMAESRSLTACTAPACLSTCRACHVGADHGTASRPSTSFSLHSPALAECEPSMSRALDGLLVDSH